MTKRIGNVVIISPEPEGVCESCGSTAELRPYGPNGMKICFSCGMKPEYRPFVAEAMLRLFGMGKPSPDMERGLN